MINILKKLLDFIYENKCYFCSSTKENTIFCMKEALEKIDLNLIFSNNFKNKIPEI